MRIIRGRKAVITGAASGIGKAIAIALSAAGADLFLIDKDGEGLANVAKELERYDVEVNLAVCDLAIPADITATINRVLATWNCVHIVVNCAGVLCYGALHLTEEQQWRDTIAVNLLAPMQIVHQMLNTLLDADEAHIVNVSSIVGLVPAKKLPAYQASKFGLIGFSLGLCNDYHRENFGVTALCPGFVSTPLLENVTDPETHKLPPVLPAFLCSTPEAVAAAAVKAIRRNQTLVLIGPLARTMWWLTRLSPALVNWFIREGWRRRGQISLRRKIIDEFLQRRKQAS